MVVDVPVFDHVLGPLVFKFLGNLRPFFALFKNELCNKPIFSSLPLTP